MIKEDRLREAQQMCATHQQRMMFAYDQIYSLFPLTVQSYSNLKPEEISFFDQLIFRFAKLQDSMGGKLFPLVLDNLGEDSRGIPFIDILTKMERIGLLVSANDWLLLRETRNIVTHEYPFDSQEIVAGLNLLYQQVDRINDVLSSINAYCDAKFVFLKDQ